MDAGHGREARILREEAARLGQKCSYLTRPLVGVKAKIEAARSAYLRAEHRKCYLNASLDETFDLLKLVH